MAEEAHTQTLTIKPDLKYVVTGPLTGNHYVIKASWSITDAEDEDYLLQYEVEEIVLLQPDVSAIPPEDKDYIDRVLAGYIQSWFTTSVAAASGGEAQLNPEDEKMIN